MFDEFGRPAFRALPPLDRYEFTLDPAGGQRLKIGQRRSRERGVMAEHPCVPKDDRVYSAYPRIDSARGTRLLRVGGRHETLHRVALGIEFPLEYPRSPTRDQ